LQEQEQEQEQQQEHIVPFSDSYEELEEPRGGEEEEMEVEEDEKVANEKEVFDYLHNVQGMKPEQIDAIFRANNSANVLRAFMNHLKAESGEGGEDGESGMTDVTVKEEEKPDLDEQAKHLFNPDYNDQPQSQITSDLQTPDVSTLLASRYRKLSNGVTLLKMQQNIGAGGSDAERANMGAGQRSSWSTFSNGPSYSLVPDTPMQDMSYVGSYTGKSKNPYHIWQAIHSKRRGHHNMLWKYSSKRNQWKALSAQHLRKASNKARQGRIRETNLGNPAYGYLRPGASFNALVNFQRQKEQQEQGRYTNPNKIYK
jgi:hypothetical protein